MRGLISHYSVAVIPIVLGGGIPMFAAVEGQQSLKRVEAKTYPDGIVMLNYEPHER